jgi:hypothetical protein
MAAKAEAHPLRVRARPVPSRAYAGPVRRARGGAVAAVVAAGGVVGLLAGCGGTAARSHAASAVTPEAARKCLTGAGLRVIGGRANGNQEGPAAELIVTGTFIAFYNSEESAKRSEREVAKNAASLHGSVQRRGRVTVLYVRRVPDAERKTIERCVA